MKRGIRLMALGIAIAVNGAALMAVNASMIDGAGRELHANIAAGTQVVTAASKRRAVMEIPL